MIDSILKRFCADEVKILVAHMEEHFDEFEEYGTQWSKILNACSDEDRLTRIEKMLVNRVCKRKRKVQRRERLLAKIIKEKIAPEHEEERVTFSSQSRYTQADIIALQANMAQLRAQQAQQASQLAGNITISNGGSQGLR